ncbi:MAG: N-6 DNA methylase [Holophagaceae bacterium]|nr:N-6 DNA methylase [Holophagaceae bacterium]
MPESLPCLRQEWLKSISRSYKVPRQNLLRYGFIHQLLELEIIHFYENFLTAYDPKLRKSRGVYYTPQPVVSFIVRAVDEILQKDFGLQRGLTDTSMLDIRVGGQGKAKAHKVQILDPALGTGTFLAETVRQVYEKFKDQKGQWQSYVEQHLVPRLNGFEILMAPYAMAHLKLDWLLTETGYKPDNSERLRIFLTNSLEDIDTVPGPLFAQFLANESREALSVKRETPVMVVMGNPPYSGISSNTGEWITRLLGDYKKEPASNSPLNERKHWLNDDYVKFIRLGQFYIDRNREGILAFINNHSFLDNPTFRGMRWHLMSSFDKIYVINLHGNAKKMEVAPGGGKDENVFDIQQGVSINFFVKTKHKKKGDLAEVSYLDLYGSRQFKYDYLLKNGFQSLAFDRVKPTTPFFFMVPKDESNRDEYEQGFSVNKLMQINTSGIVSMGDSFAFADTKDELDNRLRRLLDPKYTIEQLNEEFSLGKNYADFVVNAKSALKLSDNSFIEVSYRPFETKWTYFDNRILWRPRTSVMRHFVDGQNIGLLTCRQSAIDSWEHVGITRNVIDDCRISNRTKERGYVFPLYLHPALDNLSSPTPTPNLNMGIVTKIAEGLGMKFDPKAGLFKKGDKNSFTPIDLLDYMYAVLHSPSYRAKYKEFLKIDFPRVPFPSDATEFRRLVTLGTELRLLHLMEHPALEKPIVGYPIGGSDTVEKLRWEAGSGSKGRVWINDAQCIDKVPLVAWEFCVGGYQPAQKWLKDRKGRKLTYEDINHYQRIISVLKRTNEIMERIDD